MKTINTKKIALTGVFVALGVILNSVFVINLGVAKAAPMQHLLNVLAGVLLGPWYALSSAFLISLLRLLLGTGSLLAFPGSMIGAVLAGYCYHKFGRLWAAAIGEIIGTGIIGALIAYPIARLFLGSQSSAFFFISIFSVSTILGASIAYVLLRVISVKTIAKQLGA